MYRPISYEQHGMWVAQKLRGRDNTSFSIQQIFRVTGALDRAALESALTALVARHEPLRTTFAVRDGRLVQVIGEPRTVPVPVAAAEGGTEKDRAEWIRRRAVEIQHEGFDLEAGPLLRCDVLAERPERHTVVLTVHHLAADGWSVSVLLRDLPELYAAAVERREPVLPELAITYSDWTRARELRLESEGAEASAYWREHLRDIPPAVALPTERPLTRETSYRGEWVGTDFDAATLAGVARLAQASRASSYMVLQAAFAVLAARWTGQDDQVFGAATANRADPETYDLIGCFVGVLPTRVRVRPDQPFTEVLRATRAALLRGQQYEIPYELIVRDVPRTPGPGTEPVFRIGITSVAGLGGSLTLPGLDVVRVPEEVRDSPYDLALTLSLTEDAGRVDIAYPFALFDRATIETVLGAYTTLLNAVADEPERAVGTLPLPGLRPAADPGLPQPVAEAGDDEPPRGPMEELVRDLWTRVLKEPVASRYDDFFLLGGSSLTAVQVGAELSDALGFAVSLRTVYEYSDLSELAERLEELRSRAYRPSA